MTCPKCGGKGRIILTDTDRFKIEGVPIIVPCPKCNQQGITYCCEGNMWDDLHLPANEFSTAKGGDPKV